MNTPANISFAVERTLGKLSKWLRILGFDAVFELDVPEHLWHALMLDGRRVLLTRSVAVRQHCPENRLIFITSDHVMHQLEQVIKDQGIAARNIRPFSRCICCNLPLAAVGRETVTGKVPDYILETQENFRCCNRCKRIYWPGSHIGHGVQFIQKLFDS